MYSLTYSPLQDGIDSGIQVEFDQMFIENQANTSPDTEDMFKLSLTNSYLPRSASHNFSSIHTLKCLVNTAFALYDKFCVQEVERLEETIVHT